MRAAWRSVLLGMLWLIPPPAVGGADLAPQLRVITDDNYPPYLFRTADGELTGYLVDYWKLWEAKTGVPVALTGASWADAQERVLAGEADVIDMIFRTPAREPLYDFTPPYADLPVNIYSHSSIAGIAGVDALKGFRIGVQAGDACAEELARRGISDQVHYPDYTELLAAAQRKDVRIFCLDQYPAEFYLYRLGLQGDFRKAFTLYTGQFRRAVPEGHVETLALLERGMSAVTDAELRPLVDKWFGEAVLHDHSVDTRLVVIVLAALAVGVLVVLAWIFLLRQQVTARTRDLQHANAILTGQRAALQRTEKDLLTSQEQLHLALASARAGTWLWDLATNENVWSDEVWPLYGLDRARTTSSYASWMASIDQRDVMAVAKNIARAVADQSPFECTWRVCGSDPDRPRWLLARGKPILDSEGRLSSYIGIVIDITERKQDEDVRRSLLNRLELATKAAGIGIWFWDLEDNSLTWDQRLFELYQAPREAIENGVGYDFWRSRCHPEDLERAEQELAAAVRGERPYDSHFRIRLPDGSTRYIQSAAIIDVDASGKPVRFVGINRDLTEQKQAEAALRESERRYREVVQSVNSAIIRWSRDGTITFFNDYAQRFFGWTAEEVVGKLPVGILVPDEASNGTDLGELIEDVLRHPERHRNNVNENVCRDGRRVWMSWTNQALRDERGEVTEILAVGSDITERLKAEEEVRLLNADLERRVTERTAELGAAREQALHLAQSKSEFLANMSHEIRTPMNAVLGLAYLLERQDLPEEARELARKIHQSGQSLLGIINDILDLSKIESGKIDIEHIPFRLSEVLDNLATIMTAMAAGKAIEPIIIPPVCSHWRLRGDPLRLGQILINLTNNAIKFTESGLVEVRIDPVERTDGRVLLRFSVRDTGIGIDAESRARLFQPFAQADASTTRRFGGTGLGLAISYRLAELMGGRMGLESRLGEGSTFWFEVPLETVQRDADDRRQRMRMQVLVVEDNPVAREGLRATVVALGWAASEADSDDEVLRRVLEDPAWQGPEAAVLLNWQMAGRDSLILVRAIREALPEARWPLLIVLAAEPVAQVQQCLDAGMVDAVLSKPLTPSPLYDAVVRARSRRRGEAVASKFPVRQARRLAGLRLLVVDDSEINREVARRIFADEGALVSLASDGREALDWLRAHSEAIDLVLMDVQMPVMDGHEATRRIRRRPGIKGLPVVALTAGAMRAQEVSARASGMDAFVSKPIDVDKAVAVILSLTRGRHAGSDSGGMTPARAPMVAADPPATDVPDALPGPRQTPTVQDLPGLAIGRALALWNDAALYRRYLRKFAQQYRDSARRIATAEPDAARQLAHKLKGAAANLGLTDVAACAGDLERLVAAEGENAPRTVESRATATAALQSALATALDSCARYAPGTPASPQDASEAVPQALDPDSVAPLLRAALEAFAGFDPPGAEPPLIELGRYMPGEQLSPLRKAVEEFDARGGEAATRTLAARLGVQLKEDT